jgi:hypothetical protein
MSELLPRSMEARLRLLAERIYPLGPYPLFHLFGELVAGADPLDCIEKFARLSAFRDFIRVNGGDQFPPRLFIVNGTTQDD